MTAAQAIYNMPYAQFAQDSLAIAVVPVMEKGVMRLAPTDSQSQQALDRLGELLLGHAPGGNSKARADWVAQRLDAFMAKIFPNDVWYGQLPKADGESATIVLIKDSAAESHGVEKTLRRIHAHEVVEAVRQGFSLPEPVRVEYGAELEGLTEQVQASANV